MKTERNILIAFLLNLSFSAFEFVGGIVTGSAAILSDAIHDAGDSASIGIAYFLEKKSKAKPDNTYTYGYARYSVMGGFITTIILFISSVIMICHAVNRIINPTEIHYNGMILFAIIGTCVNLCAALFTREGGSLNQKAVNLHMLEDVLGWVVVLVGAIVMRFTDFVLLDPVMSIGVSIFIFVNAFGNLKDILDVFLEKAPHSIDVTRIRDLIAKTAGVLDVHHVHIWSMDGENHYATMHIVTDSDPRKIKSGIRKQLQSLGIGHVTLELETSTEECKQKHCRTESRSGCGCGHHHRHRH